MEVILSLAPLLLLVAVAVRGTLQLLVEMHLPVVQVAAVPHTTVLEALVHLVKDMLEAVVTVGQITIPVAAVAVQEQ
jgi:hypothetical protein